MTIRRPRAPLRIVAWAVAITVAIAVTGYASRESLLRAIGEQLVEDDPLERADAIVVLAGGTPGREIEAADLFAAGVAPQVVLTVEPHSSALDALRQRGVYIRSEIEQRLWYLEQLKVPRERIVVLDDERVVSTAQEAALVERWSRTQGIRSVLLVTSRFHSARAKYVFQRAFDASPVAIRMRAAALDPFHPDTWWQERATLRTGVFEWQRLIWYRLRY